MLPISPEILAMLGQGNASSQDEQLAPVPAMPQAQQAPAPNALQNMGGLALLAASGNPMFQQFAAQMMMAQGEDQRRAAAQKDYQNFQMGLQARQETIGANQQVQERNFAWETAAAAAKRSDAQRAADDARHAKERGEDLSRDDKRYADSLRMRQAELGASLEAARYGKLRDATNDTIRMIQGFTSGSVDPMEVYKLVQMDPQFIGIKDPKKRSEYIARQVQSFQEMGGKPDARMLDNLINAQASLVDEKDRAEFLQRVKLMAPMEAPSVADGVKNMPPALQKAITGVQSLIVKPAIENREMTAGEQQQAHAMFTSLATSPEGRKYFDETMAPAIKQTLAAQFEISPDLTDRLLRQMAAEAADASQSQLELTIPRQPGQRLAPLAQDEGKRLADLQARSRKVKSDLSQSERDEMATLSRRKNLSGVAGFFRKIDQGAGEGMRKSAELERKARGY